MTSPKANNFSEEDLVFVKVKGYCQTIAGHWPAKIIENIKNPGKKKIHYKILWRQHSSKNYDPEIFSYAKSINKIQGPAVDNFWIKFFNQALKKQSGHSK